MPKLFRIRCGTSSKVSRANNRSIVAYIGSEHTLQRTYRVQSFSFFATLVGVSLALLHDVKHEEKLRVCLSASLSLTLVIPASRVLRRKQRGEPHQSYSLTSFVACSLESPRMSQGRSIFPEKITHACEPALARTNRKSRASLG